MVEPPQAWLDELFEWLRIPSVSADPAHADDVRAAGQWVCDFVTAAGGSAELVETGGAAARDRRDPGLVRSGRGAHSPPLRALRRPATGAARALGVAAVRARASRRLSLRTRCRRRQGERVFAPEGGTAPRRGGRASRQRARRLRRGGGDRRPLDRRLPGRRRARRGRLPHLRQRHAEGGHAQLRPGRPRAHLLPRARPERATTTCTQGSSAARR